VTGLSVEADLVLEREGREFRLWSEDDRLVFAAPSLAALRAIDLGEALPIAPDTFGAGLAAAELTVEIQVRRATVARLGAGVESGPLGRWLTGTDAAVDLGGVSVAAVRALG
jgi:hypothetical protein